MNKLEDFLDEFNLSSEEFESTGLVWKDLLKIQKDYENFKPELTPPANYLIETLYKVKKIHSVRFRIKSSSHLIEKIIRKKIQEPERIIDLSNYKTEITDLIGLRALHLFKEDWLNIHHFINGNWNLKEPPTAYYRKGDSSDYIDVFKKFGCTTEEHPFGYRSVHYLVETNPNKTTYISEVQVRTIFEEGWSEIDHTVRYPYDKKNKLLNQFLVIFNRLAGNADEMGSYVQYLKDELAIKEKEYEESVKKKVIIIEDLKKKIEELELKPTIALQWQNELDEILKLPSFDPSNFNIKIPDFSKIDIPDFSNIEIPDSLKLDIDFPIEKDKFIEISELSKRSRPKKKPTKKTRPKKKK